MPTYSVEIDGRTVAIPDAVTQALDRYVRAEHEERIALHRWSRSPKIPNGTEVSTVQTARRDAFSDLLTEVARAMDLHARRAILPDGVDDALDRLETSARAVLDAVEQARKLASGADLSAPKEGGSE